MAQRRSIGAPYRRGVSLAWGRWACLGLAIVLAVVLGTACSGSAAPTPPTLAPAAVASPVSGGAASPPRGPSSPIALAAVASHVSGGAAAASASMGGETVTVNMLDTIKFDPDTVTVQVGTTVTWKNTGQQVHTATDDPSQAVNKSDATLPEGASPWDSGYLNPGQSFSYTFTVPGTYSYFCIPHEVMGMVGKVVVTP